MFLAGFGQFLDDISFERSCFDNVVIRLFRVEHREPVVMAGGETDVFHPGILGDAYPLVRIEFGGIESVCQFLVLRLVQAFVGQHPFAVSQHTVYSPVDKHTEFGIPEPFPVGKILL